MSNKSADPKPWADTGNMQGELNAIWDKLRPAFRDKALPEDTAAQNRLKKVIAGLEAHTAERTG